MPLFIVRTLKVYFAQGLEAGQSGVYRDEDEARESFEGNGVLFLVVYVFCPSI